MTVAIDMPGFTAEDAIYNTTARFCFAQNFDSKSKSASVKPAVLNLCDVLHDMSWNAYDANNYELVGIIDSMMEGAGCFR